MLQNKRNVLEVTHSTKNDESDGTAGKRAVGTLVNELKLFKYFKQQFQDIRLTHKNECTEKSNINNKTQNKQLKRNSKTRGGGGISVLQENKFDDLKEQFMKIKNPRISKVTDKQQLNEINDNKINDKCKNTEREKENFLLHGDNYNVVINKMNGIQYKQEQKQKLIKQKSQNYFKQLKQSQYSIYWRACCFLSIFNATIHRNSSKNTATTTTSAAAAATATTTRRTTKTKIIRNRNGGSYNYNNNFNILPKLGASSFVTIFILLCLELVLLSTVTNCAKTFYMHWNTSNSM